MSVSHKGRNAGIVAVIAVVVILAIGFLVYIPMTSQAQIYYPFTSTSYTSSTALALVPQVSTVTYETSSSVYVTITQSSTTSSQVWNIASATLGCNEYVSRAAGMSVGWDVQFSWGADDTVDVWVFSSSQFSSYTSGGTTSPNIFEWKGAPASGSSSFHVSGADTYYLVLHNPHNGLFCVGSHNLGIYSGTGTATYTVPVVQTITQVHPYTTSSQTIITRTSTTTLVSSSTTTGISTSTTTKTCSVGAWNYLLAKPADCP